MNKIRNFITDVYESIIGLVFLFLAPLLYLMSEWRRGDKRGVLCFVAPFVLIGLATLMLTLVEAWNDQSNEFGRMNGSGQRHGHWVLLDSEGRKSEGRYVNGKKHGRWIEQYAHGSEEGQYVDDKRHGQWVMRLGNEVVYEGPYLDGKQHGRWVVRDVWSVREGTKMGGKAHGHWVFRYTNGDVLKGRFVDGTPHGMWILELADGGVGKALIVNGEGPTNWTVEYADGVMGKCSFSFLFGKALPGGMFRQCFYLDTNGDMWMGTKDGPRVAQKPDGTGVPFMLRDSHQILRYVVDGDDHETCLENNGRIVDCRSLHPTIRP